MKSRKRKQDIRMWRASLIVKRIDEYNERRRQLMTSGQAQSHREQFQKWEAGELEDRHLFERQIQTATP